MRAWLFAAMALFAMAGTLAAGDAPAQPEQAKEASQAEKSAPTPDPEKRIGPGFVNVVNGVLRNAKGSASRYDIEMPGGMRVSLGAPARNQAKAAAALKGQAVLLENVYVEIEDGRLKAIDPWDKLVSRKERSKSNAWLFVRSLKREGPGWKFVLTRAEAEKLADDADPKAKADAKGGKKGEPKAEPEPDFVLSGNVRKNGDGSLGAVLSLMVLDEKAASEQPPPGEMRAALVDGALAQLMYKTTEDERRAGLMFDAVVSMKDGALQLEPLVFVHPKFAKAFEKNEQTGMLRNR